MIFSPQKSATNVPMIKNGANGTWLFKPFLPNKINPNPIIAPKKKDKNSPAKITGNPKSKPKRTANFTSPKPIHRPLEIRYITPKKVKAIKTAPR